MSDISTCRFADRLLNSQLERPLTEPDLVFYYLHQIHDSHRDPKKDDLRH